MGAAAACLCWAACGTACQGRAGSCAPRDRAHRHPARPPRCPPAAEGNTPTGFCAGDSGGPLLLPGLDGAPDRQVGIVSWGSDKCGDPAYPDVYTDVGEVAPWIEAGVRQLSGQPMSASGERRGGAAGALERLYMASVARCRSPLAPAPPIPHGFLTPALPASWCAAVMGDGNARGFDGLDRPLPGMPGETINVSCPPARRSACAPAPGHARNAVPGPSRRGDAPPPASPPCAAHHAAGRVVPDGPRDQGAGHGESSALAIPPRGAAAACLLPRDWRRRRVRMGLTASPAGAFYACRTPM